MNACRQRNGSIGTKPFNNLHAGGPDALFEGRENVIEGIFATLKTVRESLDRSSGESA